MSLYMGLGMHLLASTFDVESVYMGLGMTLLASTFDVESVVFLFLVIYGPGGRPWDGLVGVNFGCRMVVGLVTDSRISAPP